MLSGVLGGSGFGFRVGLGSGLSKALPKTLPTIFLQFCAPWGVSNFMSFQNVRHSRTKRPAQNSTRIRHKFAVKFATNFAVKFATEFATEFVTEFATPFARARLACLSSPTNSPIWLTSLSLQVWLSRPNGQNAQYMQPWKNRGTPLRQEYEKSPSTLPPGHASTNCHQVHHMIHRGPR